VPRVADVLIKLPAGMGTWGIAMRSRARLKPMITGGR
jgi:hypothetical protein